MNEPLYGKRAQCEWVRSMWRRGGAAVASSGLKHGAPRDLAEGRAKLSIQSRERATSPANFLSLAYPLIYYCPYCRLHSNCCAAATANATANANAGRLRGAIGAQGGGFAA